MLATRWTEVRLPTHHPDMLVLRVRKSAARIARLLARDPEQARAQAPGLYALHRLEQTGKLHHAHPLGSRARRDAARARRFGDLKAGLLAAAREHDPRLPNSAHLLVHLHEARQRAALHRALRRDPHVAAVAKVPARYLHAANPTDGLLPPERMWNHARIQLAEARRLKQFRSARGIRVAVLDSGVQTHHPSLRGRVHEYVHRWAPSHQLKTSAKDIVGHGTHITGIINAGHDRTLGIEGIAPCRLTVMKVFDDRLDATGIAGTKVFLVNPLFYRWSLEECFARRYHAVNLSLGGPAPPDPHEAALLRGLLQRRTVIVAAMGNALKQRSQPAYPAAFPGVIAVGAVGPDDVVAPFSRRGPHIALCAPGVAIWSTLPTFPGEFGFTEGDVPGERRSKRRPLARNTRYDAWPGTSGACPHVTAAVALLLASRGHLTPAQVKTRLQRSADRVPGMHGKRFDPSYGAGRLNLRKLLER